MIYLAKSGKAEEEKNVQLGYSPSLVAKIPLFQVSASLIPCCLFCHPSNVGLKSPDLHFRTGLYVLSSVQEHKAALQSMYQAIPEEIAPKTLA